MKNGQSKSASASVSGKCGLTGEFQRCDLANKVREIAQAARRIVNKFVTLAADDEIIAKGKSSSYQIPANTMAAITRCEVCSPRFFEKQGFNAAIKVAGDLRLVATFIDQSLKSEPSLFLTTGRNKIAEASAIARTMAENLSAMAREAQRDTSNEVIAVVTPLSTDAVAPVDLMITARYQVQGVGPIAAIVQAIAREQQMVGPIVTGHLRGALSQSKDERVQPAIIVPIARTANSPQAVAQLLITVDPSVYGGRSHILKDVSEYLLKNADKIEHSQFEALDDGELHRWSTRVADGIAITIVTCEQLSTNQQAQQLLRQTGTTLKSMLKFEQALEKFTEPAPSIAQPA